MIDNKVIVYTNEDGSVSVCVPGEGFNIEDVQTTDTPTGSLIQDRSQLPMEYEDFFDAWVLIDNTVIVDTARARELTKKRLRTEREPLLAQLDVQYLRAIEGNVDVSEIVAEKQRLRNITNLVDSIDILEELRELHC